MGFILVVWFLARGVLVIYLANSSNLKQFTFLKTAKQISITITHPECENRGKIIIRNKAKLPL